MIKMKNTVEAVEKNNWAIFPKEGKTTKDVSGLTANPTQLLSYKKLVTADRYWKSMWWNSIPRVMIPSCLFHMTLLKLAETTVGNFFDQNLRYILPQHRWNKVPGGEVHLLVADLDSDTQSAVARQVEVTIDLFWLLWKCNRFLLLSSFTSLIILKESMVYRQDLLRRKLYDWTWGDSTRTWLQYHRISRDGLFCL